MVTFLSSPKPDYSKLFEDKTRLPTCLTASGKCTLRIDRYLLNELHSLHNHTGVLVTVPLKSKTPYCGLIAFLFLNS